MRPSDNAILTARIVWKSAREGNTYDDWSACFWRLDGMALLSEKEAELSYFSELREAALEIMRDAK